MPGTSKESSGQRSFQSLLTPEGRPGIAVAADRLLGIVKPDIEKHRKPDISLKKFALAAWTEIDPDEYSPNWHLDAIYEHLEAVSAGQIKNLIINIPPRCSKSITTCVLWPSWEWSWRPERRYMFASYALDLSKEHSRLMRRLLDTSWYLSSWGHVFRIRGDKDAVIRYDNDRGGYRFATSVSGQATGIGGDCIVVDDPIKIEEAESELVRNKANNWYKETMTSRRNQPSVACRVLVMQRSNEMDLTGFILSEPGADRWEKLIIPMEYEPFHEHTGVNLGETLDPQPVPDPKPVTSLGWSDPRNEEGELLWPERFTPSVIDEFKEDLGDYAWAGQYQQRPAPRGGGMLRRDLIKVVAAAPTTCSWIRYWDKAGSTSKRSSYTAGVLIGRDALTGKFYIKDIVRGRWVWDMREPIIKDTAAEDGQLVLIWVEQEPASGGKESAQSTARNLAGFVCLIDRVSGDKTVRAGPLASQIRSENLAIVRGPWNEDFLRECETFPNGRYKDQVDAAAGGLIKLSEGSMFDAASAGKRMEVDVR